MTKRICPHGLSVKYICNKCDDDKPKYKYSLYYYPNGKPLLLGELMQNDREPILEPDGDNFIVRGWRKFTRKEKAEKSKQGGK